MSKKYLEKNVLDSAIERISFLFDEFEKIYLSFSGGKDSSVMMHLALDEAKKRGRKIGILFIDLEAQYAYTIKHVEEMIQEYKNNIDLYWVCLPIVLRNAVSVYEPRWICWDEEKKDVWVRGLPKNKHVISDIKYFHFFKKGMEFEEFVPKFGEWYSGGEKTACMVGIRADESLNRFRAIKNEKKIKYKDKQYTTKIHGTSLYNAYPIYDWKTRDVWTYNSKFKKNYNKLYDIMHSSGLSIHQQRICQPYGDDQRKGLYLFHVIEPDTWSRLLSRVSGANSGAEFVQYSGNSSGRIKITKPESKTWREFSEVILSSMPGKMKEHYENKIFLFIRWWNKKGSYRNNEGISHSLRDGYIPDSVDQKLESSHKAPSWRRICKMLLRNDFWAKEIGFSQTKSGYFYNKYMDSVKKRKQEYKKELLKRRGLL